MKYKKRIKKLQARQKDWDELKEKQGTKKPGSFKK